MNQLITTDVKMTSLDISTITGKMHADVMKDIRKEIKALGEEIAQGIFPLGSYKDKNNQDRPCYKFGRDGAMQLALKYDAKTRYKVIKRIDELESGSKPSYMIEDPVKRAEQWIEEQKDKQFLLESNSKKDQIIGKLKPKADYTDVILRNKTLVTVTQIAKDYGMSGQALNNLLHELGVQYKQSGQWLLYSNYHNKGYTHSETIDFVRKDGRKDVKLNTKWTQRGRLFLYDLLKEISVIPSIERVESNERIKEKARR